jgi:hypothetical protein
MPRNSPLGVFINCPFDSRYKKFFDAIVFTVIRCGFDARCAIEIDDGGGTRIDKIMNLIEACPFGIHDICRTEPDLTSKLPRFNMPLELGIFLGARRYGGKDQQRKQCLILDKERFRYQKFISDISGQDIHAHDLSAEKAIYKVRDFLRTNGSHISGGRKIYEEYLRFEKDKRTLCRTLELDPTELTFKDLTHVIAKWIVRRSADAATISSIPPRSARG